MPITIVLADGFDDHDVELAAAGEPYVVENVTTSLLTGMAAEILVDAEGTVTVTARIVRGVGAKADPQPDDVLPRHRHEDDPSIPEAAEGAEPVEGAGPVERAERVEGAGPVEGAADTAMPVSFEVPEGATLVLSYDERGLDGTIHTDPIAFG